MDATTKTERMTVNRWARAISSRHEAALKLLTGEEVETIRHGLQAIEKLPALQAQIDAMDAVKLKLDEKAR